MNIYKKLIIALVPALALLLGSCQNGNNSDSASQEVGSEEIENNGKALVEQFFTDFQQENDGWTKTTDGHNKLAKAFSEKMTTDVNFAKAIASYGTHSYHGNIRKDDSISSYSKGNGEEGEIKAFEFVIPVNLIKPLYNGQKEIEVSYEIISTIPSTIEDHSRPYIGNVNYCSEFSPYFKTQRDGVLNLGSFVVTQKDNPEK